MNILSIETSCDETAVSILNFEKDKIKILSNKLYSQSKIHSKFGGVFPTVAKREHIKILPILLKEVLKEFNDFQKETIDLDENTETIGEILKKNDDILPRLTKILPNHIPNLDYISVTVGPGLSPALYVGVNLAKILALLWNLKIIPVNHMEAHLLVSLLKGDKLNDNEYPMLSLLVSGGHTELILSEDIQNHKKIGETLDDAVGEAFDKVGILLGLKYPAGPELSKLAAEATNTNIQPYPKLPVPLKQQNNFDFSYSGLKTAVKIYTQKEALDKNKKLALALAFENTAIQHLLDRMNKAIVKHKPKSILIGGGVSANKKLQEQFFALKDKYAFIQHAHMPEVNSLSTDNSIMIGIAGFTNRKNAKSYNRIEVDPNLSI